METWRSAPLHQRVWAGAAGPRRADGVRRGCAVMRVARRGVLRCDARRASKVLRGGVASAVGRVRVR